MQLQYERKFRAIDFVETVNVFDLQCDSLPTNIQCIVYIVITQRAIWDTALDSDMPVLE